MEKSYKILKVRRFFCLLTWNIFGRGGTRGIDPRSHLDTNYTCIVQHSSTVFLTFLFFSTENGVCSVSCVLVLSSFNFVRNRTEPVLLQYTKKPNSGAEGGWLIVPHCIPHTWQPTERTLLFYLYAATS